MKYKKIILISSIVLFIIVLITFAGFYFFDNQENIEESVKTGFELDTLFLKVSAETNGTAISNINIKNLDNHTELFNIRLFGIEDLVNLSEDKINLDVGEEQDLKINFNTNKEPGIYVGELIFSSSSKTQKVPVILEIQSKIVVFDANVNIYPIGEDLIQGSRLNTNIRIYDLASIGKHDIKISYFIKSFDGLTSVSEKENLIIDGKLDYTKGLDISKNLKLGNYVFAAIIEYTDIAGTQSIGISSAFFNIVKEKSTQEQQGVTSDKTIILIVFMFGFFFLIFLGLFIYSLFFRDKMLKEISRQYQSELRRQSKMIEAQRQQDYTRLKTSDEKREYKKEVNKIKKLRLKALRDVKDKKIKEFNTIKRKFRGNKLKVQLIKWKKQGYDTQVLEKKYKLPNIQDIRNRINKWKKQGYDTQVLEKR